MPEFAAPWWLAAVPAVVVLIRWLHRYHGPAAPHAVSALHLWRSAAAADASGHRRSAPDPRWRRRAALAALLLIAAAGPVWTQAPRRALDVWIDDRASLFAIENGATRFADGLAKLAAQAGTRPALRLRSLTHPGRSAPLPAPGQLPWDTPGERLELPLASALDTGREQWLLSDGSAAELAGWVARMPFSRRIAVGRETGNVALTRLALRAEQAGFAGLVTVFNAGPAATTRRLRVRAGRQVFVERDVALEAGQTLPIAFHLAPLPAGQLSAQLAPGDPLPLDDALALDLAPLQPLGYQLGDTCPDALRHALATHPGLVAERADGALQVACGGPRPIADRGLWIPTPAGPRHAGLPAWSTAAGALQSVAWPADLASATGATRPGVRVLARVDDQPVLLQHPGTPGLVEARLVLDAPALARDPRWPLLVDALLAQAAGRPLLDREALAARDPRQAVIAPRLLVGPPAAAARMAAAARSGDAARWLLLAAALLALYEAYTTARRAAAGRAAWPG